MGMRGRVGRRWRRWQILSGLLALAGSAASCSATAVVPQRGDQASERVNTTLAAPVETAPIAPTQMWIDDNAIDDNAVIVRTGTRLAVFDAATLAERWRSDAAVLSADRRTAVAAEPAEKGRGTMLTVVDVRRGATRRTVTLAEVREVVAVSPTGTLAAVVDPLTLDAVTGMPQGRTRSSFEIIDLVTGSVRGTYVLQGNYVPEALDDNSVAIIEYLPSEKPERYRVRRLDLQSGAIGDVFTREKTALVEEMEGYGRAAVASTDGHALFTLYRDAGRWGEAFVHQLLGGGALAFCIDLPARGFDEVSALALSPDDRELYVAGAGGAVAVIDARAPLDAPLQVHAVLYVAGVVGTPAAIAVTTDTIWLLVDGQLVTVRRSSGERVATRPADDAAGVGVSADGRLQVLADRSAGVRRP